MMSRHYAPQTKIVLSQGREAELVEVLQRLSQQKVGVLLPSGWNIRAAATFDWGPMGRLGYVGLTSLRRFALAGRPNARRDGRAIAAPGSSGCDDQGKTAKSVRQRDSSREDGFRQGMKRKPTVTLTSEACRLEFASSRPAGRR